MAGKLAWPALSFTLQALLFVALFAGALGWTVQGSVGMILAGLLLLTDDGPWLHQLTHPKHHVPKRYLITLKHPCDESQLQALHEGVLLHGETEPCRAKNLEVRGERLLAMSIEQGKYHQVKRMLAAAGNRVEALHREQFGKLTLGDLAPGEWCYLDDAQTTLAEALE